MFQLTCCTTKFCGGGKFSHHKVVHQTKCKGPTLSALLSKQVHGSMVVFILKFACSLSILMLEYSKRIISKAVNLCEGGVKEAWKAYPVLSKNLGPLTAKVQHPVKETAVAQFVSRFGKSVTIFVFWVISQEPDQIKP